MSAEEILIMVLLVALVVAGYRLIRRAVREGVKDALRDRDSVRAAEPASGALARAEDDGGTATR